MLAIWDVGAAKEKNVLVLSWCLEMSCRTLSACLQSSLYVPASQSWNLRSEVCVPGQPPVSRQLNIDTVVRAAGLCQVPTRLCGVACLSASAQCF